MINSNTLTKNVFGFEQTYMYEILVTGPLCTSECTGEGLFLQTVQTCSRCHCRCHCRSHTQCRYLNYKCKGGLSVKFSKQYEWLQNAQWRKAKWSHVITAHSIITMLTATSMAPVKLSTVHQYHRQRFAMHNEALVYMHFQIIDCKWQNAISW